MEGDTQGTIFPERTRSNSWAFGPFGLITAETTTLVSNTTLIIWPRA